MEDKLPAEKLTGGDNFWFPQAANEYARNVDLMHDAVTYVSIFLFFALIGVAIFFSIKYRETAKNRVAKKQVIHNIKLELTWIIVPFMLAMVMFGWGFKDFLQSQVEPHDAIEIKVIGQKWNWIFEYPGGVQNPGELVVPEGRAIKLLMTSKDVLHSFFIPNFRLKRDVIPYRYTSIIIKPEEQGTYPVFCTEYCGDQHSTMLASLVVTSEERYNNFLTAMREQISIPPEELGEVLYTAYGCNACHSLDGATMIGPSWKGLFGSARQLNEGEDVIADENYIRSSIVSPGSQIVKGYVNVMPSFGYLKDKQIEALIAYMKTLK